MGSNQICLWPGHRIYIGKSSGRRMLARMVDELVASNLPGECSFMAVAFVNDDLPITITEVEKQKYFLFLPILKLTIIGYWTNPTSNLLRVVLKLGTTLIFAVLLVDSNGLAVEAFGVVPFRGHTYNFSVDVGF